jgi:formylglycine-generating enzyme required for sulfatase activity
MAGNAWEWTSDLYRPYPYSKTIEIEAPPLPPGQYEDRRRTLRGGSCMAEARWARCSARAQWRPMYIFSGHVGFRAACDH